jgi:hypothetical protein
MAVIIRRIPVNKHTGLERAGYFFGTIVPAYEVEIGKALYIEQKPIEEIMIKYQIKILRRGEK